MTCKSFCALIVLVLFFVSMFFCSRHARSASFRQYAFPAVSSAKLSSVFVDSGAFPNGIYNDSSAFVSLNRSTVGRIYGLFSSSAPSGTGPVSMWVPVVHKTLGKKWKHVLLPDQLFHRTAQHSLFSTHLADTVLHATPFLTRNTHCLVFDDGWVAPFSPDCTGIFMQVVYAPASSPPPETCLPPHCVHRPVHDTCVVAAASLTSSHALAAYRPPVPAAAYDAAVHRRAAGIVLDSDEPVLSHAVSRGVARSSPTPHVPQLSDDELRVWRMMGFPFNRQWRWAYDSTLGHGLTKTPPPVHMFTDLHVLPARMRALPFARFHAPRSHDVVGALIHIDYHTGLPPSRPHGFLHHCSLQDDASRFGRMYPTHNGTAVTALDCLRLFVAELSKECNRSITILCVVGDNVPFASDDFRRGLAAWPTGPVKLDNTGYYAHQQAGRIERFHGVRMATARVLLRWAQVPGTWWPYATSCSNIIHNILPHSVDHKCGPLAYLRGRPVSWKDEHIDVFGLFGMVWLAPPQRGETAKQLADRALPGIYLGRCADSKDAHFFMLDAQEFRRAPAYRLDYNRPPPGWPLRSGDRARAVDVLSEMLALPDQLDVGSYLIDELPLPSMTLPLYDDQEGGIKLSPTVDSLPNISVAPIIIQPTDKVPMKSAIFDQALPIFDLTPTDDNHPAAPIFDEDDDLAGDPLSTPTVISAHGDKTHFSSDHCSTRDCLFPRNHSGPCSNQLPGGSREKVGTQSHDGRPSTNLRPRHRANFTHSESTNMYAFLLKTLTLAAVSTSDACQYTPHVLFASSYDNMCFLGQPDAAASIPIPRGLRQALASDHRDRWLEAIYTEYHSILSHNVFEAIRRCDVPPGVDVMRCHCIFTVKANKDGSIERYKCRLVADGNTQTFGINFQDIFATVVKFSTFRLALHLAAVRDYEISAIDISTAFLYGDIDNDACFMAMPEGLPRYDAEGYELVCHLLKSIYGLRQAPRVWFNHFLASLIAFGFVQSKVDPCLFIYNDDKNGVVMYGLLWVDDLVILTNNTEVRNTLVTFLRDTRKYKLTDKGTADWLLGIALTRDRPNRTITLSQQLYIQTVLERFRVYMDASNARSYDVPALDEISSFSQSQCPAEGSAEHLRMQPLHHVYMSIIGALIWISSCTHPHLCVVTNVMSRFSLNPGEGHFAAVVRVLLYLRKHPNDTLTLGGTGPDAEVLRVITDASHEDGPSISGVFIVMGMAVIDWICRRQKSTSRSSLESEALANAEGAQDGVYKRELAKEFGVHVTTTDFYTDSDSSIKLHKDVYACKKSKHIIKVITMLREWIQDLVFAIRFISGVKNYADLLTKPLGPEPFRRFRDAILSAKVVLPDSQPVTANYASRLVQYLLHAVSLPD